MHTTIYTYLHTSARAFRLAPDLWLRDNMQRGDKDNLYKKNLNSVENWLHIPRVDVDLLFGEEPVVASGNHVIDGKSMAMSRQITISLSDLVMRNK